ncbi:thioredoxin family protein [Virgibacillus sp. C22-A2]|uniref:Thioredoxin family protein n=1 Tax=Virgibacillus tibetensis TaxID=3042313 RepID=A0ABU6K9R9_9BACI|nr:thioredoxin family protein [Virgibacillus sp. C22-A2]
MIKLESEKHLSELIKTKDSILYFTAGWCPDCVVIEPILPQIEGEFPDYTFIKVDRDQFINVCQEYNVFGIPSFIAFKNGKESGRLVSKERKTEEEIMQFLKKLPE